MTPFSERLTVSISSACRSMLMFLWMMPMPPSRAIAMAILEVVTVSIAAVRKGELSRIPLTSSVEMSTSAGTTSERAGTSSTSSKVSPSFVNFSLAFVFSIRPPFLISSVFRALTGGYIFTIIALIPDAINSLYC